MWARISWLRRLPGVGPEQIRLPGEQQLALWRARRHLLARVLADLAALGRMPGVARPMFFGTVPNQRIGAGRFVPNALLARSAKSAL